MGTVSVECQGRRVEKRLAASTLVGRHWRCDIIINDPRIPLYWLEVRWMSNDWAWRELTDTGATRGPGTRVSNGWRTITSLGKKTPRIIHPPNIALNFIDLSAPALMVEDLSTREQFGPDSYDEFIEIWDNKIRTVGWDAESSESSELLDGDTIHVRGRTLRVHASDLSKTTARAALDVTHKDCKLDIDMNELTATFTVNSVEAMVHGEFVRTLAVYAQTRLEEHFDEGGWLSRREAHRRWIEFGGNPDSPEERIGWDRGKLRTQLATQGGTKLKDLFTKSRTGSDVSIRLNLTPEQLSFTE